MPELRASRLGTPARNVLLLSTFQTIGHVSSPHVCCIHRRRDRTVYSRTLESFCGVSSTDPGETIPQELPGNRRTAGKGAAHPRSIELAAMRTALTSAASNVTQDRRAARRPFRSARDKESEDTNINSRPLFVPLIAAMCATNDAHADNDYFSYQHTNLVFDGAIITKTTDKNLQNPWGIAALRAGQVFSTLYTGLRSTAATQSSAHRPERRSRNKGASQAVL